MTDLHQTLADLARDHGEGVFSDADAFRGALDDYLDEGAASTGTINLLTDAVRLGALAGLLGMLDSGAGVESAVSTAGQRLARDRGSADVTGSQWAVAVLGAALGRVPGQLATRLRPDAPTVQPGHPSHPGQPTGPAATVHRPAPTSHPGSPGGPPWPGPAGSSAPGGYPGPYGGPPPARKSRTGLVVGLAALAVVLVLGLVVGLVLATGGDDDPGADGASPSASDSSDPSSPSASESASESSSPATTTPPSPTGDPARTFSGDGYSFTVPTEGWKDVTDEVGQDLPSLDTVVVWGESIETGRGNVLVETSSSFGETDPEALRPQWEQILESSTGAKPEDHGETTIGGEPAVGVVIEWTNQSNVDVRQVAYLVVHDDQQYSITASSVQSDQGFEGTFEEILATWQWH